MEKVYASEMPSPIGKLYLAATQDGICAVSLDREDFYAWVLDHVDAVEVIEREYYLLKRLKAQLRRYFKGQPKGFDLPVDLRGTTFQRKVWKALAQIPYGETRSYENIARQIGSPRGFRAVGSACGANPLLLVIPCHRVVGSHQHLGGFSGGIPKKVKLLKLEKAVLI